MNKFLLLAFIMGFNIYSMNDNDMALDDNDFQATTEPIWRQIPWRSVPPHEFSLQNRIDVMDAIATTLSGITTRLLKLPCNDARKTALIERLSQFRSKAISCRHTVANAPIDPAHYFIEDLRLRQLADSFLVPYHRAESDLRRNVEDLENMVRQQNAQGIDDLLERLNSLTLEQNSSDH